mmetsp:Transcript_11300/g.16092  ORF Transcript_11300/g.16092 Transcript_11300/m.16092 type:complete len:339 (+) Transcript_11300:109-1125(+)
MWRVWFIASRPHTLTASLSPCLVGYAVGNSLIPSLSSMSSLSSTEIPSTFNIFVQWFSFCICIQLATNLHNDYADFVRGADTDQRVGQARATQKGWLTPQQTAGASTACLVAALAIGINLLPSPDDVFSWCVVLTSAFNAVAYTGGPYPLGYVGLENVSIAYWGLGDLFCLLYFGLVATIMIPYFIIRYSGNTAPLWDLTIIEGAPLQTPLYYATSVGFWAIAIIVVNNLRDERTDVLANKRTLAVRFGGNFCRAEYLILVIAAYGMTIYDGIICIASSTSITSSMLSFLPLLTIPLAIPCVRAMQTLEGGDLNPFVGGTARVQLFYCILLSIGIMYR